MQRNKLTVAATLYAVAGIIFIVLTIVSRKVGVFLPIGIAFIILALVFWRRGQSPEIRD